MFDDFFSQPPTGIPDDMAAHWERLRLGQATPLDLAAHRAAHLLAGPRVGPLATDMRICELVTQYQMVDPFVATPVGQEAGVISYGLSSFGYDMRVADEFLIFTPPVDAQAIVDPKHLDPRLLRQHQGPICLIPVNDNYTWTTTTIRFTHWIKQNRDLAALRAGVGLRLPRAYSASRRQIR